MSSHRAAAKSGAEAFPTVAIAVALVSLVGCERGCLLSWLGDRGAPTNVSEGRAAFDFSGTDCSGGLARCVDDQVEISRTAHVPASCAEGMPPEGREVACACPWMRSLRCEAGCAAPGWVVVVPEEDAAQLCRPGEGVLRDVTPTDPWMTEVCSERAVRCVDGVVVACDGAGLPSRAVGVCMAGCAERISVEPGPGAIGAGAGVILCRRPDPERAAPGRR